MRFSEKYFAGFWVQVNTLIRRNEGADALLDDTLQHPMLRIVEIMTDDTDNQHGFAQVVLQLYVQQNLGIPPGSCPTEEQLGPQTSCTHAHTQYIMLHYIITFCAAAVLHQEIPAQGSPSRRRSHVPTIRYCKTYRKIRTLFT